VLLNKEFNSYAAISTPGSIVHPPSMCQLHHSRHGLPHVVTCTWMTRRRNILASRVSKADVHRRQACFSNGDLLDHKRCQSATGLSQPAAHIAGQRVKSLTEQHFQNIDDCTLLITTWHLP